MMEKEQAVKEFSIDPNWTTFDELPKSIRGGLGLEQTREDNC